MNGILLADKPKGWTSFDVVAKVRGLLRTKTGKKLKVGHTGTLDPQATGLLVLLIGDYTKRAPELTKLDKIYEVTIQLGQTSTTGDEEGNKVTVSGRRPDAGEVEAALQGFAGQVEQTPPAYSAVKINGQRAYKLARAGQLPELKPRKVTIYAIQNAEYDYPQLKFIAKVSSGTYIRTLAEDIGQALQTGAYLSGLRRTSVGQFDIKDAVPTDKINAEIASSSLRSLDSPAKLNA